MQNPILIFVILFLIFLLIRIKFISPSPSDTPAGAIVMACGIFINGTMKNIYFLEKNTSQLFAMILFLFWIFIAASYINSVINGSLYEMHLKNPIKSFAIGTWVAGTSVCGIALYQRLPWMTYYSLVLFYANIILWLFYIGVIIRSYGIIFMQKLFGKVHGVLLLSTVSTQSIVVFGSAIFGAKYPKAVSQLLIVLGVALYIPAFVLVIRRYFFTKGWTVEDDWQNTNCILHGAMSITGLASASSGAVAPKLILLIWLWVISWFIIVEAIEIYRAFRRIMKYGFQKGIAVYDVTQWSRIFTFGMLYAFTMRFNIILATNNSTIINLRNSILKYGTWVMICILGVEALLFFTNQFSYRQRNVNRVE